MTTPTAQPQPTLGVVAICRNEATDMPAFLAHLLPWVDELVIVDDGSDDGTPALVAAAGPKAKLIVAPRAAGEFFSDQRNKGIAAATSDWLLHLDIDERILPVLAREIRAAIADPDQDAYRLRRLNFFMHRPMRGGGWQHWRQPHLARRAVLRFGGMYHETCELTAPADRVGALATPIWHLNDRSYRERLRKSTHYCEELAARIEARIPRMRWYHILTLPVLEWARRYVGQRGYRDGTPGLILAGHSAGAMFRACVLLWEARNGVARATLEDQVRDAWEHADPTPSL